MNIISFLTGKLSAPGTKIIDSTWLDQLSTLAEAQIVQASNPYFRVGAQSALDAVLNHRQELIGMTDAAVCLMLQQLASGNTQDAQLTYIVQHATADDLIGGMNADADEEIDITKRKLNLEQAAIKFIEEVGVESATHILPLILSML